MNNDAQVLARIRSVLESDADRGAKAERVAELIRHSAAYRWVGLYIVEGDQIIALGWSGPRPPAHLRFPLTQGLCGAAVLARATQVVGDVSKDPRYLTTFGSTRSEIIVPVLQLPTGAAVGLLDAESERLDAFSDDDRRFLEECAAALVSLFF